MIVEFSRPRDPGPVRGRSVDLLPARRPGPSPKPKAWAVRQATDVQGAVTAAREWTPYAGEWFDADVEAQYLRARWYDVAAGRFTSRDPLNAEHPYAYVNNNPLNWIDPTGYFSEETIKNSIDLGGFLGS